MNYIYFFSYGVMSLKVTILLSLILTLILDESFTN